VTSDRIDPSHQDVTRIPPGHPSARIAASAFWCSILTGLAFSVWAFVTTQYHSIGGSTPWQDDPYHGVISFTEFLVPAVTVLMLVRAALRRRDTPQPAFRADQLARTGIVLAALVGLTVLTDALASALRVDHALWTSATPWLIASLAPLAALAVTSIVLQRRTLRSLPQPESGRPDGDWLDDLVELIYRVARVRVDRPIGFIREHIMVFALLLSLLAGALVTTMQAIGEGGEAPMFFSISVLVVFGGFLAFCLICNVVLHIAVPRDQRAAHRADSRLRRAVQIAVIAAALALPASAVLRDSIWALLGHRQQVSSVGVYVAITTITALLIGLLAFGGTVALTAKGNRTNSAASR
jgi:uncharacterized protein YggT (Ycf19 family)